MGGREVLEAERTDAFVLFNIQANSLQPRGPVGQDFAENEEGGLPACNQYWNLGKKLLSKTCTFTASIDVLAVGVAAKGAFQSGTLPSVHMQCWASSAF